jgi:hypothetical protein
MLHFGGSVKMREGIPPIKNSETCLSEDIKVMDAANTLERNVTKI